ncbi:MAG: 3'(2'),5'-bisphosphate nucleotidase CysQ, partial [Gammaproteobacteria bacterium]|nr:3'(2'),5'-bisphosphate nucleotidase CysQ [Gammaproteobacteria bacterium]
MNEGVSDLAALLEPVVELTRVAGDRILEIYNSDFEVEAKADNSPLTAADMASHHAIVAGLEKLTPAIPVLSEESASLSFAERSGWPIYWLVDPL